MAASTAGAFIRKAVLVVACAFLVSFYEWVSHHYLSDSGTLSSHSTAHFFLILVTVVIALGTAPIAVSIAEKNRSLAMLRHSEEQYRLLFDSNSVPMYVFDRKTLRYLAINQATIEQYGYSREEFLSMTLTDLRPAEDVREFLEDVVKGRPGIHNSGIWRHRRKDGAILHVEIISHDLIFNGKEACLVAAHDITERKQAEDTVRQAEEKYRGIFENSVVGIFQSLPDGRFLSINPALANMHGYDTPAELMEAIGSGSKLLVDPTGMNGLAKAAEEFGAVHGAELEILCKDGSKKWVRGNMRVIRNASGTVVLREGTVEDITHHKAAQERMHFLAYYDALTELPNRSQLHDYLDSAMAEARRTGEKIALLFVDLDRFKSINDAFGHPFGDMVLKNVAKRLKECIKKSTIVARIGGDEFLIVLGNLKGPSDAIPVAKRLMEAIKAAFILQNRNLSIGCSIGISIFPEHGDDAECLIRNADLAMYASRENGHGNIRFFNDEMHAKAIERLNMDNNLKLALDREEFFLLYQPQIEVESGRISGFEALIRWKHPEFGMISPGRFIRSAEDNGLILPIGEWALRTACDQASRWQNEGLRAVPVAVNVSAVQFRQDNFLSFIRSMLNQAGLSAEYLELEITESVLLSNEKVTLSVLRSLKEMGVRLSIDDFGTGYSCLSYLRQYPIDKLKIDKSFIQDCVGNSEGAAITASIINMAHSLRLRVIAEGVESEEQMTFLRHHRCGEIQGYYFSRPVSADDAVALLKGQEGTAYVAPAGAMDKLHLSTPTGYSGQPLQD